MNILQSLPLPWFLTFRAVAVCIYIHPLCPTFIVQLLRIYAFVAGLGSNHEGSGS